MTQSHPPISADTVQAMIAWRHDLHAHPELAFTETRTADVVARALTDMGLRVHRGLARTGVVGTLQGTRSGTRSIGLRADMDALPVTEANTFGHASTHPGCMHACGHDGHTAMLLGAARHLAANPDFAGTVHFIFQPAEETDGGARIMVEDGLFERFPCEAVFGMHNWPGLPVGMFAVNHGPMMAAFDTFEITVQGRGTHAAMPERGVDPFMAVAHITMALQTIASRYVSALDAVVVSVTQIHGGDAWNVIPDTVVMRGTVRYFLPHIQDQVASLIQTLCTATAEAYGAQASVTYNRDQPATINTPAEADLAITAAQAVVGAAHVRIDGPPAMASEDFSFMLQKRPGAYVWVGADGASPSAPLHNPHYDFNDDALGFGAAYWVKLVHTVLAT